MMTGMAVIFRRPAVAMRLEVAPQLASWDKAGTPSQVPWPVFSTMSLTSPGRWWQPQAAGSLSS
jgi:hypothetical protein